MPRTGLRNADFRFADAKRLPSSMNNFDVVYSRRGPGSETVRTLSEAYRVLRKNGICMQIERGERDKQNLARIFGRGQMVHVKGQVSDIKKKMLEKVGFQSCDARLCRNRGFPRNVGSHGEAAIRADNPLLRSKKG